MNPNDPTPTQIQQAIQHHYTKKGVAELRELVKGLDWTQTSPTLERAVLEIEQEQEDESLNHPTPRDLDAEDASALAGALERARERFPGNHFHLLKCYLPGNHALHTVHWMPPKLKIVHWTLPRSALRGAPRGGTIKTTEIQAPVLVPDVDHLQLTRDPDVGGPLISLWMEDFEFACRRLEECNEYWTRMNLSEHLDDLSDTEGLLNGHTNRPLHRQAALQALKDLKDLDRVSSILGN